MMKRSEIVVRQGDHAGPHRKKKGRRSRCGGRGSHGLIGSYGEIRTPVNKGSAMGAGLLDEDGHRSCGGGEKPSWDANRAKRLAKILGITYELSCKGLKNQLDRFDRKAFDSAVAKWRKNPISDDDSRFVNGVLRIVSGKDRPKNRDFGNDMRPHVPKSGVTADAPWKTTRNCPHCGVKGRLNRDFRFCPMCGEELP